MNLTEMIPVVIMMLIPVVAIIGGITAGIVKSHHRARMVELTQRERIAAIERGLDISQLPPLGPIPGLGGDDMDSLPETRQLRRSRGLSIWGIILIGLGIALTAILLLTAPFDSGAWGSGFFFLMLGAALVVGARVIRPDPEDLRHEKEMIRQMRTMGYASPPRTAASRRAGAEAGAPGEPGGVRSGD